MPWAEAFACALGFEIIVFLLDRRTNGLAASPRTLVLSFFKDKIIFEFRRKNFVLKKRTTPRTII